MSVMSVHPIALAEPGIGLRPSPDPATACLALLSRIEIIRPRTIIQQHDQYADMQMTAVPMADQQARF